MSRKKLSANVVGLMVCATLVVAGPFVGLLVSGLFLRGAFRDTANVDPAEKARFLAEGISESMNGMALGIVVSALALVPATIFAVRAYRETKRERAQGSSSDR